MEVQERGGARSVHAAGAGAQVILQVGDLGRGLVDLHLFGLHGRACGVLLVQCAVIALGSCLEIGVQADQLVADGVGLCLLLGSGHGERGLGEGEGCGGEGGCSPYERAPRKGG